VLVADLMHLGIGDGSPARTSNAAHHEPRPPGVEKLSGTDFWRLRVGDLRLVRLADDGRRLVVVLRVVRRGERTNRRIRSG